MGVPLVFTPQQLEEIAVLGTLVIYRHYNKHLGDYQVGMIVAYNPVKGTATIVIPGGNYHFQEVPYSRDLSIKGSWCYKDDIQVKAPSPSSSPGGSVTEVTSTEAVQKS